MLINTETAFKPNARIACNGLNMSQQGTSRWQDFFGYVLGHNDKDLCFCSARESVTKIQLFRAPSFPRSEGLSTSEHRLHKMKRNCDIFEYCDQGAACTRKIKLVPKLTPEAHHT